MAVQPRNFFPQGVLQNYFGYGWDQWVSPNDAEYIVARTNMANNTSPANLTLSATMTATGSVLPWPCRLWFVIHNRGLADGGTPCYSQCLPKFDGSDQLRLVITGKLNGVVLTETVDIIGITTITTPSGSQASHQLSVNFYDEITSIAFTPSGTFGTTTPMVFSVGLGNRALGAASDFRTPLFGPRVPALELDAILRRATYPDDLSASYASGTGLTNVAVDSDTGQILVPGRAAPFETDGGLWAIDLTTTDDSVLTKTSHGLSDGAPIRFDSYVDGLPTGLAAGTTYFAAVLGANTILVSAGRTGFTATNAAGTTFTKTAHGLVVDDPVVLYLANNQSAVTGNFALATVYYVESVPTADTFTLCATAPGGAAVAGSNSVSSVVLKCINLTAAGTFASGENVRAWLPTRKWRQLRFTTADKLQMK